MPRTLFPWIGVFAAGAVFAAPALADRDPRWVEDAPFYDDLAEAACFGDADAFFNLSVGADMSRSPVALTNLGLILLPSADCDRGAVPEDRAWANQTFRLAAERGYGRGMYHWGLVLLEGAGVDADPMAGLTWMEGALEEGWLEAGFVLIGALASGDYGVTPDRARAERVLAQLETTGMAEGDLNWLRSIVEAAPETQGTAAQTAQAETGAQDTGQTAASTGTAEGPFEVYVTGGHGQDFPQLGDVEPIGSNFAKETVFIAQWFYRNGECWVPSGHFLVGNAFINRNEYAAATLEDLLEGSNTYRANGDDGRFVTHFETLDDGIDFQFRNPALYDDGLPLLWTEAAANAWGPPCERTPVGAMVVYPEPVRAPGY